MNADHFSLKATLTTAAAAVILTALQVAGIDALATPGGREANVVQLPLVLVSAKRQTVAESVQQLPQVVVLGQRVDRATAQARTDSEGPAS